MIYLLMSVVPSLESCTLAVSIPAGIAGLLLFRCWEAEVRGHGRHHVKALSARDLPKRKPTLSW